jgi:unsaturated rhamnogalacturonyl hydrolase
MLEATRQRKPMNSTTLNTTYTNNSWATRMAASVLPNYPSDKWKWHYEHGLFVKALAGISAATGEEGFEPFVQNWVNHFVTPRGKIRTYSVSELNLDQINSGKLLYPLYRRTGDERYANAIKLLRSQLQQQPRTKSEGFWHKKIYPFQMWLDGLYMASPFYAEYALTFNELELLGDVAHQFKLIEQHTRDPKTGLLYHAWDESKAQKWANPDTGCSPHFWGRAMGWYVMALVDVLDILPAAHTDHPVLVQILRRLADALLQVQDPVTGLWFQIVDLPHRPGNYRETSVSSMLVYAFAKGVRKGYLAADFQFAAQRAYRGLLENMVKVDARGTLTLEGTCSVGGLGGTPYRDGSFEYYVGEPIAANDFKGVGSFILAALEMETSESKDAS